MNIYLKILLIIASLFLLFSTLYLVRKEKISFKYSLIWLFSSLVILVLSIFPDFFGKVTNLVGFQLSSNFIIAMFLFVLLIMTRQLTKIVSDQNKKINSLIQEVSLLKKKK